jgi:hypothetical protein
MLVVGAGRPVEVIVLMDDGGGEARRLELTLDESQHSIGFLTQSAFTGLGQTLAYLMPPILVFLGMNRDALNARGIPWITVGAFIIGSFFSISSILWTVRTTKEIPLSEEERARIQALPRGFGPRCVRSAMRSGTCPSP